MRLALLSLLFLILILIHSSNTQNQLIITYNSQISNSAPQDHPTLISSRKTFQHGRPLRTNLRQLPSTGAVSASDLGILVFLRITVTPFIAQVLLLVLFGFLWLSNKDLEQKFEQRRSEEARVVDSDRVCQQKLIVSWPSPPLLHVRSDSVGRFETRAFMPPLSLGKSRRPRTARMAEAHKTLRR